ncbi:thioredoxin-like protein [Pyronema domesticum]|uniref:Similar to Mitochondrial peroxiredoxin PRX1 acc. no. P34227 n=1 Tax=Pyronema omphalodes (strain CBS 100304) TaxID=1076935 RepID=U4L6E1_PYROM|nr:thioredoxin-like protein [Pyronema domesticum]CCX12361.1 Similar to Mitochondrial peroxiredoxin PRX1; acc. no. P34227 [Pyronema omphalodes CBS 100304]
MSAFVPALRALARPSVRRMVKPVVAQRTFVATPRRFAARPAFMEKEQPRLRLGAVAPNFVAETTHGKLDFHQYIGDSWCILFSHPADFTPVCTTELGAFAKLRPEFDARNVKLIGLSANGLAQHDEWVKDIDEVTGSAMHAGSDGSFPVIADETREVAWLYDMVDQAQIESLATAFTIRSVFIIDPAKKIRLVMTYPASTGRNTAEVLRVVDSLQTADKNGIATPVNWTAGEDVIVPPTVSTQDAKKKFGADNVRELKPYLRFTTLRK